MDYYSYIGFSLRICFFSGTRSRLTISRVWKKLETQHGWRTKWLFKKVRHRDNYNDSLKYKTLQQKDNTGNIIHNNPNKIPYPKHFKTHLFQEKKWRKIQTNNQKKKNTTPHWRPEWRRKITKTPQYLRNQNKIT